MKYFYQDVALARFNPALNDQFLVEANRRHDAAHHEVSMSRETHYGHVDWSRFAAAPGRRGRRRNLGFSRSDS